MEKLKQIFRKFWLYKSPEKPIIDKNNHVITIDGTEISTVITQSQPPSKIGRLQESPKYDLLIDILFCCMVVLFWTTIFRFFIRIMMESPSEQNRIQEFLCIILCLMIIVTLNSLQFESSLLKKFKKLTPKLSLVVRRTRILNSHILRIRLFGEREFIETEITKTDLTYEKVVEVCCKELGLEKEQVKRLWKVPETLIRNDLDVKRFCRIEYIEVHVY